MNYSLFKLLLLIILAGYQTAFAMKQALGSEGIDAYAVHAEGITGQGVNIGLLSKGNARDGHIAFDRHSGSAVTLHDFSQTGLKRTDHDTHMAGILVSSGSPIHPEQIGVCPGAHVHSAHIITRRIHTALEELIVKHHCRVIVTGIQVGTGDLSADGRSILSKLYDYYAEHYDVIFANAAGNSCPRVSIFGDSYNGITTAGLAKDAKGRHTKAGSISNKGPTADGRRKPDVAAPTQGLFAPSAKGDNFWDTLDGGGRGLTSFAVPHTAGVAALLLEAAGKTDVPDDDRSEVIKAIIVNSTTSDFTDANDIAAYRADSTGQWDPAIGYGRLNARRAYRTLLKGPIEQDKMTEKKGGWAYRVIGSQAEHAYLFSGKKGKRLTATVVWHRKLKKLSSQIYLESHPAFNMTLKILSPDGKTVFFEPASRNNLIKVDHVFKSDGTYLLVLKNPTAAEADYGLAFDITAAAKKAACREYIRYR